jgi:enoyl-CoA hydratase
MGGGPDPVQQQSLRLERSGPLAVITIDRPPLNLWGPPMYSALTAASIALAEAPPRGLLIRAEGRAVSAGVDIAHFEERDAATSRAIWSEQMEMLRRIEQLPCPTIFAAHALTLTAAFELALACDIILAAESAGFGLLEARLGITPAGGGTQRLVARAGLGRTLELVFSGEVYDAATLNSWGVVTRILDDEGFDEAVHSYALKLANGPTLAHGAAKKIARTAELDGIEAADDLMPELAASLFGSADQQIALADFMQHGAGHPSKFVGR